MPKYRGNSEDWLDESRSFKKTKEKAKPESKSVEVEIEKSNATVAEVFQNQCRVRVDGAVDSEILCSYRRTQVAGSKEYERGRSPVVVGDRVVIEVNGQSGVVTGVCKRKNQMMRLTPTRETSHIMAANIDYVVIVVSAKNPLFASGFLDRMLIYCESQLIDPIICVTKIDLITKGEAHPWDLYRSIGYRVVEISILQEIGIEILRELIFERKTFFCGQSGVGKTSLLRVLTQVNFGKVAEISAQTAKGRHTTTSSILLPHTEWIDSPGVKEFGLRKSFLENLPAYFPEFRGVSCLDPDCRHDSEEGCNVKELPRYKSYMRIYRSLQAGEG